MKRLLVAIALAFLPLAPQPLLAQAKPAPSTGASMSDGEVRKVDKQAGTVVLKHGEIRHPQMSPMTMEFKVTDPAMLDAVKPGDRVKFDAAMVGTTLFVTRLERAR